MEMYRPKNEILLAIMEIYDIEFVVFGGVEFSNGYKVVVRHGKTQCMVGTKDLDFFSTWDREREEAETQMSDIMKTGATILYGLGDDHRSWKIPSFSTIEELRMKANIAGETND